MNNLELKPISRTDIVWLDKTEYKNLSEERRELLVSDSERCLCQGEFFRFFMIKDGNEVVGVINMQGHGKEVVSVAPEIFPEHRGKGFAYRSLVKAYEFAKEKGFTQLTAGIREENIASQNLHLKLGYKHVGNALSKNGKALKMYSRQL